VRGIAVGVIGRIKGAVKISIGRYVCHKALYELPGKTTGTRIGIRAKRFALKELC
jgi:hypothetical protein